MDGNGRWAKARGLPRTKGHELGEAALFDVVEGAIEIGVKAISAYAFSTENWTRSPDEVRFLMGFNRDVIRRRRDEMHELGVRVRWSGRAPRLWKSVIRELQVAEELTRDNDVLTLNMCVNYGGRAELADTARSIAREVAAGRLNPEKVDEKTFARHLYVPGARRRRHALAHLGGEAAVELHALAGGVRRAGLHRHPLARRRPAGAVAGDRDLRPARPAVRQGLSVRGIAPGLVVPAGNAHGSVRIAGQPVIPTGRAHAAQVPTISRVWERSEKPCSEAIAEVQRSTAGPSTSTVAPQERQTR